MKIAFLNIYNGIVERGSEIFVHELATQLAGQKHEVTVYQAGSGRDADYHVHPMKGIPVVPHQGFSMYIPGFMMRILYSLSVLWFTLKSLMCIFQEDYDWVIPVNGGFQVFVIRFFRILKRYRILISGHAGIGRDDRINLLIGKPDIFVALTRKAFLWAKGIASKSTKVCFIPNGVNLSAFHLIRTQKKYDVPEPVVLCVSALVGYKHVETAIDAVAKAGNISLVVAGDGPLRERVIRYGKEKLGDRFKLLTGVAYKEMPSIYNNADVFTLPSAGTEAFGIAYLEAMACNLPVVAPDDQNRRDIIGEAGMFFREGDTEDYADKIRKALKRNFRDIPRKQAEKFSWGKTAAAYLQEMQEAKPTEI